jgi:hypothetical protein
VADGVLNMTYAQLRTQVQGDRLGSNVADIPYWLAAAYTDVWNAGNWTFRRVSDATFYTTNDGTSTGTPTATPMMPADFGTSLILVDDQGDQLLQKEETQFEAAYIADTTTGRPCYFQIVNRQIRLWPTPDAGYAFSWSYRRRLATRTPAGTVQAGWFQTDNDLPLWDDHGYILVVRAKLLGLKQLTDPSAIVLQDEFSRLLDAMSDDYIEKLPRGYQAAAWR